MNQDVAALWQRVVERDREMKEALSSACEADDAEDDKDGPLSDFDTGLDADEDDSADPFSDLDTEFDADADDPFSDLDTEFDADEDEPKNVVDVTFEEAADLWLSRSRLALEHALLSFGLTRDVFPTNRPLLVFASHRSKLAAPVYHRIEFASDRWPQRLQSSGPLTSTDAAKILASAHSEGETVAVEVPNPLLARKRWIVLWPELEELPEAEELKLLKGRQVRRVVWCVDRGQIGPRDVIKWLSRSWPDIPIRIALFRATSFVQEGEAAKAKVLPGVRRSLEKFNRIKSQPWIVVGP